MNLKYIRLRLVCLFLFVALAVANKCTANDEQFFVSFHPHLDAFWLNTDDQLKDANFRPAGFLYAMNQRSSKVIFQSMLQALQANPARKEFITEIVFFKDWYESLNPTKRQKIKHLLGSGQLEIANGGWVQNDEAVCYIDDIIDQYTVGQNYLYENFGIQTKIGWATDCFGHSHSQAAIQHILGMQVQGIERIDDRYINQRKNGPLLQFYWSAVSDSNGKKYGGVYTHIRHFLHEFVDYRRQSVSNLVGDYQRILPHMKKVYNRKKLFRFIGNDFEQFIPAQFAAFQNVANQLNSKLNRQCPTYKYGNPSDYFKAALYDNTELIRIRQSDFMPNFDQDHYWSGYFTTNPWLKVICKDFSRLVNLYRKIYVKYQVNGGADNDVYRGLTVRADELLALQQHHDGITATSKYHIQEMMKARMNTLSAELLKQIANLSKLSDKKCTFYGNANSCNLDALADNNQIYLTLLHEGSKKTQRIQISLPSNKYFESESDSEDSIFCNQNRECTLVFEAILYPGENTFKLNKIDESRSDIIIQWKSSQGNTYTSDQYVVEIVGSKIKYTLKNGDYINIALVRSSNQNSMTETITWDKYGQPIRKSQRRGAGLYIMSNRGTVQEFQEGNLSELKVVQGKRYTKFWAKNKVGRFSVTISNKQLNVIDFQNIFKPANWQMFDYFVRIQSNVKSNGVFYHDMNGYLVSKRKIGERYDYQWDYKQQDKINANTYPMCSFGYAIDDDRKVVVLTDRAQGFTTFDNDLLINIDRLAGDDYKGAGEGYNQQINSTFRHRIALVKSNNNIERLWQRQYDELVIGYLSISPSKPLSAVRSDENIEKYKWIKYTVFLLNANEFVIRLFNMNEKQPISIPKYNQKQWNLKELGLQLKFEDIKESFANGIVLSERKVWTKLDDQINIFNSGSKDTLKQLLIQPLQIRSFRVNLKSTIVSNFKQQKAEPVIDVTLTDVKPIKSHFTKRCF